MDKKWLALAGSFIIMNLVLGFMSSVNVLYMELIETFSVTRAEADMVQSSVIGVFGISGMFTGHFINWLGTRRSGFIGTLMSSLALALAYVINHFILLTVIIALGTGIGLSTMYIAALALVEAYFDGKSKMMAFSFVIFGGGIGGLWLPYLMAYLVDEYGLRGTLLIYGGILANCSVIFTAISSRNKPLTPGKDLNVDNGQHDFPEQIEQSENKDGYVQFEVNDSKKDLSKNINQDQVKNKTKSNYAICSLLKNLPFILLTIGIGLAMPSMLAITVITTDHATSLGYQRSEGVMLITVIHAIDTISRLLPGLLKQIPKMSVLLLPVVSAAIGGVSAICLPFTTDLWVTAFLFSVIGGFCLGSFSSSHPLCVFKMIGDGRFSPAIGISMAIRGICIIIAGPITGLIKDTWGSYDVAFFLCGGTMLTSSAILSIAIICKKSTRS